MNETLEKFVSRTYPHRLNILFGMWKELDYMYDMHQRSLSPMQLWMIDDEQADMVTFRLTIANIVPGIDETNMYSVCFRHAHDATTFKLMWL